MAIRKISEREFYENSIQKNPMASVLGEEKKWFIDNDKNLLGIIVLDKIDKDWSYVVLAKDEDNEFRAVDVDASMQSMDYAENALLIKMRTYEKEDQKSEILYDGSEIEKSSVILTDVNEEIKKYLSKNPEKIHDLSPRKFEELVASILEDLGFDVTLTKQTRDGGSDIIASIKNALTSFLILVECKKYSPENKVDVGIIREVVGVQTFKNPSKSIIVTTSTFTRDAIKEASQLKDKLDLKDYSNLKEWLSRY
jgi:HJR/Mrr/RecB family endonuclease